MKNFKNFINKDANIEEDTLAFTYNDGGDDQTVLITGSKSELKKVENKLPSGTKYTDNVPDNAQKISASNWLKIQ